MTERAPDYVELHARSAFSFLRGASPPKDLAAAAARAGLPALALCDRNGVYGSPRLHAAAKEQGLRALVGSELVLEDGSALPVLVASKTGYENLCALLTDAHLRATKGEARIRYAELADLGAGLHFLTGDEEGPLAQAWDRGGFPAVRTAWERLTRYLPRERLWVELQRHYVREAEPCQRALLALARAEEARPLATNGVTYAMPAARPVQDVFTCLREHTTLDQAGRLLSRNAERHAKPAEAMARLFADCPEAISNTVRLADELAFTLDDLGYQFPDYPVPPGETPDSILAEATWAGARQRYGELSPAVRRQLEHELRIIHRLGFSGYFLLVWDIVNYCRDAGVMVQGRGSAANSAVCYSLGITAVDPVGSKLLFERFLSEGRQGWPDIDLDLPSGDRREQVIQEVYRRFGERGAAMTANVITYRGRSAVREIGKVLGFPEELVNRFSDLYANGDYPHTLELQDQLAQAGIRRDDARAPAMVHLYRMIYGLPRHLGQHSGGMIMSRGRLDHVVPLENASMPGRVVAQWDKEDCEDMGIIKVDLLGLGMMAALQDAVTLANARGRPVDLAQIPLDDTPTYDLMCAAETIGLFQIESRAQIATIKRLQPRCFYDVAVQVAIVRPGPIVGKLAHPYLERRAGREPITYIDPKLEPVLDRTLGVPLFQEQVLKMAMIMADFEGSEAEELRRALGFHRSTERMEKVTAKLRARLEERAVSEEKIQAIIDAIGSFALYGFPESHAISFALLAYASAYLKVHYAGEFYTALLNNQPMGFYAPATIIQEGKRRGLKFLPPCLQASAVESTLVDDQTIRLGLGTVRGVNREKLAEAVAGRIQHSYTGVADFRRRNRFNRDELRQLAMAGALNVFCGARREALWAVAEEGVEDDLFAWAQVARGGASPLPGMGYSERVAADFAMTGVSVGRHPLAMVRPQLPKEILTAKELEEATPGREVTVGGAVICRQRPGTAKGVVFVSLEDETGIANCIVYPPLFEARRLVITREPYLQVRGRVQRADGVTHLMARRVDPLVVGELPAAASHDFH